MTTQPVLDSIAFWELDVEDERQSVPLPDSVQPLIRTSGTVDIGIFDEQKDVRTPVNEADARPGGKYHSIVKLFFRFGGSETWTTATGWLHKDDIVVTAAHCVFSHDRRATCVNASIGYSTSSEKANISTAEHRFVKRIAAPLEWINTETEQHDVAFLQLDSPFQNVAPIVCDTPEISARQHLTVVGYPADLWLGGAPGGEMYEMKIDRDINLERTKCNMLRYQGDLQGGFSGAPVIRDSDFTAIGIHVRGGSLNTAAVIGGPYGVRVQAFQEVIRMLEGGGGFDSDFKVETDDARPWLNQNMPSVHDTHSSGVETVVNTVDGRTQVDQADYQSANGKYRAIVKLFLLYDGQVASGVTADQAAWAIATGWLVSGDVVVTAGHCAYDYSRSLGRLIQAKAYVGYGSSSVAFRYGKAVATTNGWINQEGSEPSDVSFIKLNSPFTSSDVGNFYNFAATPLEGKGAMLGVVGYPGDIMNVKGERGATMFEMFKPTDYNLADSDQHMLQYQIDTYGGNSGSPVFGQRDTFDVIGVHVLGGYSHNSGSVIDGNYGNRCHAYYNIASSLTDADHVPTDSTQPDKKRPWLWKCPTVTTESDEDPVGNQLDVTIKKSQEVVADISSTVVDWDTPLTFGSKAGPQIAILASAAIAAAGRLAADSVNGSNVELLAQTRPYDGVLGRAILAESALQYFFDLSADDQKVHRGAMGPQVVALKPFVAKVAPRILKGTLEPSMRLLLSNLAGSISTSPKRNTTRPAAAEKDTGFGRKLSDDEEKFLNGLVNEVNDNAIESFFSTLTTIGDVIGSAFKKAGPILKDVAKIGLPLLLGTESGELPPTPLDPLAHRAILAEACLQTFVGIQDDATKKRIYPKIIDKLKVLGPVLMRASPFMAKYIAPVVADILREFNPQNKAEFLDFSYGKS
ncbi:hypothetical protein CLAIMM_04405 [Cladophialophora immunda]|nr:hypothetical protein CLAIMM_04405 [Cladophialophora immunda]